ncbi:MULTISPECIES: GyrI-like domain-containing protein [Corynebacterium]|uniref:GyrI-like domain-containing protein n=1 Tax=Corynebacterium TaxID=1716 RepID=UPI000C071F2A|nr:MULTISPECIES: GyrI-like domain-containing protein [Corynebacterium]MBF0581102.1 GyrI-like domain-containing protein [Corynebacterium sp. ED61]
MSTIDPIQTIDFPGMSTVVVRVEDWPMARIHEIFDATFTALGQAISQGKFTPTGPAFARYDAPPTDTATMEIGFPVNDGLTEDIAAGDFTISNSSLPQGRIAITKHRGGYDGLPQAWEDFLGEIHTSGMEFGAPSWEAYDTMPTPETDPADLITGLAVPVTGETE